MEMSTKPLYTWKNVQTWQQSSTSYELFSSQNDLKVRHTTLKKKVTTIIRNTCYGSVFEQCQETRRYTSDALRASSSISVDETDWNMSEIFWEHVCLRWKKTIYIYMESTYLSLHSCIYELTTTCESNAISRTRFVHVCTKSQCSEDPCMKLYE